MWKWSFCKYCFVDGQRGQWFWLVDALSILLTETFWKADMYCSLKGRLLMFHRVVFGGLIAGLVEGVVVWLRMNVESRAQVE